jgi:hypothetical protein
MARSPSDEVLTRPSPFFPIQLRKEEAENNVTLTGNFLCSNGDLLCHMLGRLRFTPATGYAAWPAALWMNTVLPESFPPMPSRSNQVPTNGLRIITVCVNPMTEMLKKPRAALEQSLIEHLVNHDLLSGHPVCAV